MANSRIVYSIAGVTLAGGLFAGGMSLGGQLTSSNPAPTATVTAPAKLVQAPVSTTTATSVQTVTATVSAASVPDNSRLQACQEVIRQADIGHDEWAAMIAVLVDSKGNDGVAAKHRFLADQAWAAYRNAAIECKG